jgi:hypothetical protein
MDNQSSPEVRSMANRLNLDWDLVKPYQKEPNRAERAIRTAKNHLIAVRAGFHSDCPETFIDRCLFQQELTLNLLHPFEYDPRISAHHGLFGRRFDFSRHPIAPAGTKVLTWNSPDNRGSWSDHGWHNGHIPRACFEPLSWFPHMGPTNIFRTHIWYRMAVFETPDTKQRTVITWRPCYHVSTIQRAQTTYGKWI